MTKKSYPGSRYWLLMIGDIFVILLVTVVGFISHGTITTAGTRIYTTFLPLTVAWFLVAPFMGAYDLSRASDYKQLWRPFWAMVVASPFAAWMRGIWLGTPVNLVFVFVLGGVGSIGILIWRGLFVLILSRMRVGKE